MEAAADIVWPHMALTIGHRAHTPAEMRVAVLAVYDIRWNRAFICALAAGRINHDLARLRNSDDFPEKEYERIATCLHHAYAASFAFPVDLLEWRTLEGQILTDLSEGWEAVLATDTFLHAHGFPTPLHL